MVAVAVPPAIVAAIFALLFMLAWAQWGHSITGTLNIDLPIIGNVVGRYVGYALEASYQVMVGWFDSAIGPVTDLILRPIIAIENVVNALNSAAENTYNALWTVTTKTIPYYAVGAYNGAVAQATSLTASAISHADALAALAATATNNAVLYSQSLFYAAINQAQLIGNQAVTYANSLATIGAQQLASTAAQLTAQISNGITQAEAYTLTAYHAATGYAATLYQQSRADLGAATTALETYAQTTATVAVGVLATDLDHAISGALAGIYTDVDAAVHDTVGIITTGDEDILSALRAWPASVPLDLAGLAALTGVTSLTLARYLRDCGIPNCQNLGQLGRDLQGLLSVVNDASFLAFILQLVHSPGSAASTLDNAFGDIIGGGIHEVRSLIGI